MRMCDWKPEEMSLLHPVTPSVPFVQDVREWERVALTGCLPCGYMVTGGMPVLTGNTLTLRSPASPSTRGQIPGSNLGTWLCPFWAAEGCQRIWRGVLLKQIPLLTLGLDFPPRIPWRPTPLLSGSQPHTDQETGRSREFRRIKSSCLVLLQMSPISNKNKHESPFESSNLVTVPLNYRASLLRSKKAKEKEERALFLI